MNSNRRMRGGAGLVASHRCLGVAVYSAVYVVV